MIDQSSATRRLIEIHIPIALILAFALFPYLWMLLTSLKPAAEASQWPVRYWPSRLTLEHYETLFARTSFFGNLGTALSSQQAQPLSVWRQLFLRPMLSRGFGFPDDACCLSAF
jgi:ABC-type glycerol-3-phosphate transport system permease component